MTETKTRRKKTEAAAPAAKVKKDRTAPSRTVLPCHVCGADRPFVAYRTKEGKDGRLAKWPEYAACPNIDDPKKHPRTRSRVDYAPVIDDIVKIGGRSGEKGRLFQMVNVPADNRLERLTVYLERFAELQGEEPHRVEVSTCIYDDVKSHPFAKTNDLVVSKVLTPNYGYVFIMGKPTATEGGRKAAPLLTINHETGKAETEAETDADSYGG